MGCEVIRKELHAQNLDMRKSKEQVEMLKEIEDGIGQITLGVQSNFATAEETSAVSEEIAAQATGLEETLEKSSCIIISKEIKYTRYIIVKKITI